MIIFFEGSGNGDQESASSNADR